MAFDKTIAGRFRANPSANRKNNLHLLDPNTPGTPLEDTGTIVTTGGTAFDAFTYTGKDGNTVTYQFVKVSSPDAQEIPFNVLVSGGRDALRDALKDALTQHEVDPIIKVTGSGDNFDVLHIGSGTLNSISMDGSATALSRGAITGLGEDLKHEDLPGVGIAIQGAKVAEKKYKASLKAESKA